MKVINDSSTTSSKSDFNLTLPNFANLPRPQIPGSLISLHNTVSAAQPYISNGTEWKPLGICGVNAGVIWAPFRTGELSPTTFVSFVDAYNYVLTLPKPNVFYFDPTGGSTSGFPIVFPDIPIGTYDFTGVEWIGLQKGSNMFGSATLKINIPDGVHIIGLRFIASLQINYTGLSPCIDIGLLSNQLQVVYLSNGTIINTANNSGPFFRATNTDGLGNSILSVVLDFFTQFANGSKVVVSVGDGMVIAIALAEGSGIETNTIATDFPAINGNVLTVRYLGSYNVFSTPFFPFIKSVWTNINAATNVFLSDESAAPKSYTTNAVPNNTNDSTQGWKNTDIWIDSTTSTPYICIDASTGLWHSF